MIGFLSKYDHLFGRHIGSLAALLLANFLCALTITLMLDNQNDTTKSIVQMAMVAIISGLSCIVLLRMSQSRSIAAKAFDTLVATDKLTGLTNREAFRQSLEERIQSDTEIDPFALILFDIDRFKELNAFLGYAAADEVLTQFAGRLRELIEHQGDAARISGDEFALVISYDGSNADLEERMRKVFDRLYKSYLCKKQTVDLTFSVGITLFPDDGEHVEHLHRNAQFALQRAKQNGHDQVCCYDEVADPKLLDELFLSQDMDRAIRDGEFKLFYQPQFSFATGKQTGYEVLLRWEHKDKGMISPGLFIPIAEKNGLILPLSEYMIRAACETASRWPNPLKIAINLSPLQMGRDDLADVIGGILLDTGLEPKRLELEVTESLFIDINDKVVTELTKLQKQGMPIALDDFGTGYSSLAYLSSFPFDKIKIDRSFVQNLATDDSTMAIISAVIGMGKSLNSRITAEGIEDKASYELLRIAGVDEAQGYLLGRPKDIAKEPGEEMAEAESNYARSA